jgi:hypothetical protein
MNKLVFIFVLTLFFISCKEKLKKRNVIVKNLEIVEKEYQKYTEKNGQIRMSEITVKEFIEKLKIGNKNNNELNILSTIGQAKIDWITNSDLSFLISLIDSKERGKCINRRISSFIPNSENMTIGNQAISIIESYRKKEPFPNGIYICEMYEKEKINEILKWWKEKNGS